MGLGSVSMTAKSKLPPPATEHSSNCGTRQRRTDGSLMGRILDMGGEANSTEYGFIIAARPDPDLTDPTAQIIPVSGQFGAFEHMLPVDANYTTNTSVLMP